MKVTGRIHIDLTVYDPDSQHDRQEACRLIRSLDMAPPSVEVTIQVPRGLNPWLFGALELHDHGQHLGPITVASNCSTTVERWIGTLRRNPREETPL